MMAGVVLDVEHVHKKFSRTFRAAMRYGVRDVVKDVFGLRAQSTNELRPSEFWSVRDASFQLRRGEAIGMIGPNGAGKSTMLKMLNGIYLPDRGRICMAGRVGALIELGAGCHPMLSGRENIFLNGAILGLSHAEIKARFDDIVAFADIGEFIDSPVRYYSSGMYVRLGFAIAAQLRPDILLIDEVLAVGDLGFRMKCFKHLINLLDQGVTIVVVAHSVYELARLASRGVVFDHGNLVFDGDLMEAIGIHQHLISITNDDLRVTPREAGKASVAAEDQGRGARIESVYTVDQQGNRKGEFTTGDNVYVDIHIHAEAPVPFGRLIVAIESPGLGVFASISTPYQDFRFAVEPPECMIRLALPGIPLLVGGYKFNVTLCGPEIDDVYDRARQVGAFRIVAPPINANGFGVYSTIYLKHHWERIR